MPNFKLRLKYDPKLIAVIKTLPPPMRKWSPKDKTWQFEGEVIFDLAQLVKPFLPRLTELLLSAPQYEIHRKSAKVRQQALKSSMAETADIEIPVPEGLAYYGYQKAGIKYMHERDRVLNSDQMGTGKSIQFLGICNLEKPKTILCICPAFLRLNWKQEAGKWLVGPYQIVILNGPVAYQSGKLFYPDMNGERYFIIVSYDSVSGHLPFLKSIKWDQIISDEMHLLKNYRVRYHRNGDVKDIKGSQRAKACFELFTYNRKVIGLTGTPIINTPKDLWPIANAFAPKDFPSFWKYAQRYCGASEKNGWDTSGASNLEELQRKARETFMLRRLKKDVLKELPDKTRQVIILNPPSSVAKQDKALDWKDAIDQMVDESEWKLIGEMATIRKETAIRKVPDTVSFVDNLLEQTNKVVIAVHHVEATKRLQEELSKKYPCVSITGGMNDKARHQAVKDFQEKTSVRGMILSMKAGGLGLTLTAANYIVFHELGLTPEDVLQTEDRIHRIGQDLPVTSYILAYDGSIDAYLGQLFIRKLDIASRALNPN